MPQGRDQIRKLVFYRPLAELDLHQVRWERGAAIEGDLFLCVMETRHGIAQRRDIPADGVDLGLPARAVRRLTWGNARESFLEMSTRLQDSRKLVLFFQFR